ncbi:hypothetical protein IWZ03DRAFT_405928 [Phyllosticta citriasiana]|uniref:Uncharacterized protein n=1 Tax=Phyllosticta citriasiana TaxID=595635 RepID=A0ABR1KLB8_9PEZI
MAESTFHDEPVDTVENADLLSLDLTDAADITTFHLNSHLFAKSVVDLRDISERMLRDADKAIRKVRKNFVNLQEAFDTANGQVNKVIKAYNKFEVDRETTKATWGHVVSPKQLEISVQQFVESEKQKAACDSANELTDDANNKLTVLQQHFEATQKLYDGLVHALGAMDREADLTHAVTDAIIRELDERTQILCGKEPDKVKERDAPDVQAMLDCREFLIVARNQLQEAIDPFIVKLVVHVAGESSAYTSLKDTFDRLKLLADKFEDVGDEGEEGQEDDNNRGQHDFPRGSSSGSPGSEDDGTA